MKIYKNISLQNITGEVWKPLTNYEGFYEVSNMGRVKSLDRTITKKSGEEALIISRILKQYKRGSGYLKIAVCKNGKPKTFDVHRLVGLLHVDNPENKPEINHKKGNKLDNRSSELEWSTSSENAQHKWDIGLQKPFWEGKTGKDHHSSKSVLQFDSEMKLLKKWDSIADVNRELGFDISGIAACCVGRKRKVNGVIYQRKIAYGYIWKYA
jgi:hypothetical protein